MVTTVKKEKTKDKILRVSTRMFLENGYTATTVKMICDELKISKGNFTFYFPSKEDVLAVLTNILCDYQRKLIEFEAGEGMSSLLSICLELRSMAAACEEEKVAKDFFVSTYQSPKCLEIIQKNDWWSRSSFCSITIIKYNRPKSTRGRWEDTPISLQIFYKI